MTRGQEVGNQIKGWENERRAEEAQGEAERRDAGSERAAHCVTRGQMAATLHSHRGTYDSREPWQSLPHPRLYC